jgi:hypothetical protein
MKISNRVIIIVIIINSIFVLFNNFVVVREYLREPPEECPGSAWKDDKGNRFQFLKHRQQGKKTVRSRYLAYEEKCPGDLEFERTYYNKKIYDICFEKNFDPPKECPNFAWEDTDPTKHKVFKCLKVPANISSKVIVSRYQPNDGECPGKNLTINKDKDKNGNSYCVPK